MSNNKPSLTKLTDLEKLRHSTAHLLAAAVLELWPNTKITIGPPVDNGFYYDFEFSHNISDTDLPKIEKRMKKIITSWKSFDSKEISIVEAREFFKDNPYKLELIESIANKNEKITIHKSGKFTDLCRGGHVKKPNKEIKHFKLLNLAGAYWRGDENNTMLTRIYGTAFPTNEELETYLTMLEEAKKRDHRKLGKDLDLFTFSELVGSGLPLWTPKGTLLRNLLDNYVWELRNKYGYKKVEIPHITKKDLYIKSGHWDKFSDELFRIKTREGHEFAIKPMNCPHHTQIYARKQWSYRELPQRYANTTTCYRDEQTGELHGLSRVRALTQDDAHVFCRFNHVKEEFLKIWNIIEEFYNTIGFELSPHLSFHDPINSDKYMGNNNIWQKTENLLKELAKEKNIDAPIDIGEAAFYGPKIDFMAKDSIGREWQVATIQLDMSMPESFDLTCINEEGKNERIVMIHAAIMGSLERFLSIVIEHLAGNFPLWLAPVQINIISVGGDHKDYCETLADEFRQSGLRVEVDNTDESVSKKIRNSAGQKIPYVLVIGDKEMNSNDLSVRVRGSEELMKISKDEFVKKLKASIANKVKDL